MTKNKKKLDVFFIDTRDTETLALKCKNSNFYILIRERGDRMTFIGIDLFIFGFNTFAKFIIVAIDRVIFWIFRIQSKLQPKHFS